MRITHALAACLAAAAMMAQNTAHEDPSGGQNPTEGPGFFRKADPKSNPKQGPGNEAKSGKKAGGGSVGAASAMKSGPAFSFRPRTLRNPAQTPGQIWQHGHASHPVHKVVVYGPSKPPVAFDFRPNDSIQVELVSAPGNDATAPFASWIPAGSISIRLALGPPGSGMELPGHAEAKGCSNRGRVDAGCVSRTLGVKNPRDLDMFWKYTFPLALEPVAGWPNLNGRLVKATPDDDTDVLFHPKPAGHYRLKTLWVGPPKGKRERADIERSGGGFAICSAEPPRGNKKGNPAVCANIGKVDPNQHTHSPQ